MTKKVSNLPHGLDCVADEWRKYIAENVSINMSKDFQAHVPGTHSTYHMTITFNQPKGPLVLHYAGRTGNPGARANAHKSELGCCKTTTRTGKSVLYHAEYFEGVREIDMHLKVHESGYTEAEVKHAEKALADKLQRLYPGLVLTRPRKN